MISLLLAMTLGGVVGFMLRKYRMVFLSIVIQLIICLLLFFLGLELGSDATLRGEMSLLGMQASVITLLSLLGSLLMSAIIYRLFFKKFDDRVQDKTKEKRWGFFKGSIAIFLSFFVGLVLAILELTTLWNYGAYMVTPLLYALLFFVGISVGKEHTLLFSIRKQGARFLILPMGTLIGTLLGAALAGAILSDFSILDSMSVGSGMGYYSLSSVLLGHAKGIKLGSIALMSNVLRELITLFFAPLLIKAFGPLSPISAGGVTSMDITLPVIIRFSGREYAALAIFHGAVLDPIVPLLISLFTYA